MGLPAGTRAPERAPLKSRRLPEPTFEFAPGGGKTSRSATRGLDEHGPYDSESFTPKNPVIAVVTPAAFKGTAEMFIRSFLDGVPRSAFAKGFTRKYHLGSCAVAFEAFEFQSRRRGRLQELVSLGAAEAEEAGPGVRRHQRGAGGTPRKREPLPGLQGGVHGAGRPGPERPDRDGLRADGLAYALDSIALASYAKLGGTPYVVAAAAAMTQELVIGIGSAHVRQARLTDPERVVGITTVFSADGNYLLSNTSREADYADYPAELLRSLESCIEHVRERNGWQPEDALRLIFHVFKPLRDVEARAVKDLAQKLAGEYAKVEFAFLNLNDDHDWLLFDQNGSGYNGRGVGVPGRGHAVAVSRSEMLISVTGPRDMKLRLQGLPKPLLLKLHRESTFTDLEYLAGQVFRFTSMSWRRPHPSREPVTILYSDLIAGLLGHLRHVKNWNSDIVSSPSSSRQEVVPVTTTARRQHPGHDLRELVARYGRTADRRWHRTGQHRLAARPLLPRRHPRARPEPGEQIGCPPPGWRRTTTASGRHQSSPQSATVSLELFPVRRRRPEPCSSRAFGGL